MPMGLPKIVIIENTRFVLGINVILKSDITNKMEGHQTERWTKGLAQAEKHEINSFTDFTEKHHVAHIYGHSQKYLRKPLWFTVNVQRKMCILDLP